MLQERILEHQQTYQYKLHRAKLALVGDSLPTDAMVKIKTYLFSVFADDFPDGVFQSDLDKPEVGSNPTQGAVALRSSQSDFEILSLSPIAKQNLANDLAALGLLMARRNRDRPPCVQDFMLANDSSTTACEVPVYLTREEIAAYKARGFFITLPHIVKPITGHIDVVQVRNGLIHLLDYKPKAATIEPVNQLLIYALALASRTSLPVKLFKCAWFDERDYFEFFPLQAVLPMSALTLQPEKHRKHTAGS